MTGPGVDLIADDPGRALELLNRAYQQLDEAENAGYPIDADRAAPRDRARRASTACTA